MTSYFDQAQKKVRVASSMHAEDAFMEVLADIEGRVVQHVNLVTGDREFPDDLREQIQGIIAVYGVSTPEGLPPTAGYKRALLTHRSTLLHELHEAFHDVARRKIATRFGKWGDDPEASLVDRVNWERDQAGLGDASIDDLIGGNS